MNHTRQCGDEVLRTLVTAARACVAAAAFPSASARPDGRRRRCAPPAQDNQETLGIGNVSVDDAEPCQSSEAMRRSYVSAEGEESAKTRQRETLNPQSSQSSQTSQDHQPCCSNLKSRRYLSAIRAISNHLIGTGAPSCTGCAVPTPRSSHIGHYVMVTAEHREPCDSRGSCTVLGAPEVKFLRATRQVAVDLAARNHFRSTPSSGREANC